MPTLGRVDKLDEPLELVITDLLRLIETTLAEPIPRSELTLESAPDYSDV
ncbi:hypothetical protein IMCC9480_2011 [Oxalobacteraceae bacterium IMCC9480]|nr:hypothetical protein IMCC9480_2011 [Oxalobacteraceae bacterium IMCC9480]